MPSPCRSIARLLRCGLPALAWASLALPLAGCIASDRPIPPRHARVQRHGPPSHAPAHGYRREHEEVHERASLPSGVELVFDRRLGIYLLVGLADYYYDGHRYYRRHRGQWQVSLELGRGWTRITVGGLPRGLRASKRHSHRKRHRRGHGHDEFPADADDD
ncbi:MAG: hypothetical protein ACE5IL_10630 [Myxococcota bacterium]